MNNTNLLWQLAVMNAHGELNELEQFKAIAHNLHFVLCQIILSLDRERGGRKIKRQRRQKKELI